MKLPLASPHRRGVPWQGVLVTVSLLLSWSPPISAQAAIESVPLNVAEGSNVLLLVHNVPPDCIGYNWYKGGDAKNPSLRILTYSIQGQTTSTGPAYSGRETVYNNGSLVIQKVTQNDMGIYTLQIIKQGFQVETTTGQFHVYRFLTKPSIQASNTTVTEHKGPVVLACLTNHTTVSIQWIFNGQSLQLVERTTLSQDNRSLTIDPVKREDAGEYQCEVSDQVTSTKSDPLMLTVKYVESLWVFKLNLSMFLPVKWWV